MGQQETFANKEHYHHVSVAAWEKLMDFTVAEICLTVGF